MALRTDTKDLIIDPHNENVALEVSTGLLLMSIRRLPDDSPHLAEKRHPTLAEIKASPIIGYEEATKFRPHPVHPFPGLNDHPKER